MDKIKRYSNKASLPEMVLFIILVVALTWPAVLNLSEAIIGDPGDSLLNAWILSWNGHKILSGDPADIFNANIFHPHRYTLAYSENLLGLTVIVLPVIYLWGNPLLTYNAAILLSFYLSALGAYFLVRHLTGSRPAAFISGLIFAFFPWRFGHLSHLQLQAAGWIPLAFLFLHRLQDRGRWRDACFFSICFTLQFLSCGYYGLYLALFAGLFMVLSVCRNFRRGAANGPYLGRLVVSLILAAGLIGPVAGVYLRVSREQGFKRPLDESVYYSADVAGYVSVNRRLKFWGNILASRRYESNLFPGLTAILLAAGGALTASAGQRRKVKVNPPLRSRPRLRRLLKAVVTTAAVLFGIGFIWIILSGGVTGRVAGISFRATSPARPLWIALVLLMLRSWLSGGFPRLQSILVPLDGRSFAIRFYLLAVIVAFLFTLGPVIKLLGRPLADGPYRWLYDYLPGFQGLRVPSRMVIMVALGLSVLAGYAVAALGKKFKSPVVRLVLAVALSLAVIGESAANISLARMPTGEDIPPVYHWLAEQEGDFAILELPLPGSARSVHTATRYMYFSTYHWKRLVNGYSGFFPEEYDHLYQTVAPEFPSEDSIDHFESLGIRYLIIHYGRRGPGKLYRLLEEKFSHRLREERIFPRTVVYSFVTQEEPR
jgi:hypothetical protein